MKKLILIILSLLFLLPINIKAEEIVDLSPLFMYSSNYILIDQDSSQILASKNPDKKIHPASITKALTLITILEELESSNVSVDTLYQTPEEAIKGIPTIASIADFQIGDTLPIIDYLYGIQLPSGADATRIMSYYLTEDPEGLSLLMNDLAKKIGMTNSNFANTSGLDQEDHYSTVSDLALLIQYALKNEVFEKIYTTTHYTTQPTPKHPDGIQFSNYVLEYAEKTAYEPLYGAKSGYTELAERALSSVATKDGLNLIFVSTNAPRETLQNTNVIDAINTYKLTFDSYQKITLQDKNQLMAEVDIQYRSKPLSLLADKEITQYYPKSLDSKQLTSNFVSEENLVAPIEVGSKLGVMEYRIAENLVHTEDVLAQETIDKSFRYKAMDTLKVIMTYVIVIIILLILLIIAIRYYNLQKIRKRRREMGWVRRKK